MHPYDSNIVIDLEFTPVPKLCRSHGMRFEIIEIGAVRVDSSGQVIDRFQRLVRPTVAASVSWSVTNLTGITWGSLREAQDFEDALADLSDWIGAGRARIVAWSGMDKKQIVTECNAKGIQLPANLSRWMDLQRVFPRMVGIGSTRRQLSLHNAVEWYGLELADSQEHRALADAEHTAALLGMLLSGEYLEHKQAMARSMRGCVYKSSPAGVGSGLMSEALAALYQQMTAASSVPACA